MPKKKSSKTSGGVAEEVIAVEPRKEKPNSEIDDIFAGAKRKEPEKNNKDKEEQLKSLKKKKKKNKDTRENQEGRFTDPPFRPRRKTEDGFTIYTEEELGIDSSNGGNTSLCPFDCDCCF